MWCWRSISCFRLLASLPYMSIGPRVVIAISFQKVDHAPYAEPRTECCYKYLQCRNCRCKKCHTLCFQNRSFTLFCCSFVFLPEPGQKGRVPCPAPFPLRPWNLLSRFCSNPSFQAPCRFLCTCRILVRCPYPVPHSRLSFLNKIKARIFR